MMIYGNTFMRTLTSPRLAAALLLALAAGSAGAQYIWVDDKGIKQVSDRPPPASVPAKNILKQPRSAATPSEEPAKPAQAANPAAPTLAERDADFRKRAQEKAERDQKSAEEARQRAARQQACASARAYLAQLNSGERIGTVASNGERAFMGDAERARETAAAQRALAACK